MRVLCNKVKRIFIFLLVFILSAGIGTNISTAESSAPNDEIKVVLNGEVLKFDVNPYIKNSRTLVPFRKIFEAFGLDVEWNPTTKRVFANGKNTEITLKINDPVAYLNSEEKTLDAPPEIKDSRTFVPLRFIGESVGAEVIWDSATRTVNITYSQEHYSLGQSVTYKDLKFELDKLDLNTEEGSLKATGKINTDKQKLFIYFYYSNTEYVFANSDAFDEKDGVFSFEANSVFLKSLGIKKIDNIQVKILTEDNSLIKICEYQPY
ncbi:MAG: copper amine oxidase N-terminal domain-containing protein [Bacillota bacterium]|nr:copper amine oxidase N-terminal domain-containing protein [Bacillota bacterium]